MGEEGTTIGELRRLFAPGLLLLYAASFFNFLSLALTLIPTISQICLVIGGSPTAITSETAFVTVTAGFIGNVVLFCAAKYNCGLSDDVGRKPLLICSGVAFIVTRFLILAADKASIFYLAALIYGCFDNHYPCNLAYIADITTEKQRAKVYAVIVGFAVGLGFTIGAPLGGVLMERYGIPMPFYVSVATSALYIVFILLVPFSDTLGNEEKKRRLPTSWSSFLRAHHPFSGLSLIRRAAISPYDWATNYLGGVAQQTLQSIFLLYVEGVLGFTPAQAGEVFAFIGISIAIFGPLLLARWQELALVSTGMLFSVLGFVFMSVAGVPGAKWMGYPGFLVIAVGGVWNSALTSVITLQYNTNDLGSCAGVFAQLRELAILPAYPISLFFAYSLSSHTISKGAAWLVAAVFLILGVAVQVLVHKSSALTLKRRVVAVTPEPSTPDAVTDEQGQAHEEGEEAASPSSTVINPLQLQEVAKI